MGSQYVIADYVMNRNMREKNYELIKYITSIIHSQFNTYRKYVKTSTNGGENIRH